MVVPVWSIFSACKEHPLDGLKRHVPTTGDCLGRVDLPFFSSLSFSFFFSAEGSQYSPLSKLDTYTTTSIPFGGLCHGQHW